MNIGRFIRGDLRQKVLPVLCSARPFGRLFFQRVWPLPDPLNCDLGRVRLPQHVFDTAPGAIARLASSRSEEVSRLLFAKTHSS